jgi:putative copper resistance protein D
MTALLAAARFVHFASIALLFGLLAFPVYARVTGEAGRTPAWVVRMLAVLAAASALLVLLCAAANMTGYLTTMIEPATLGDIVLGTGLGRVWAVRSALGLLICILAFVREPKGSVLLVLTTLFLISIALAGHSRMDQGALGLAHPFADALHLIAASAWIGGLLALVLVTPRLMRLGRQGAAAGMLHQFSGMGYFAVATLITTGLFKTWLLVGSLHGMIDNRYGWVLDAKLVLFAGMGVLALLNRFWITPNLERGALEQGPLDADVWLVRLMRQAAFELILGLGVLAAVGALGALEPPISL